MNGLEGVDVLEIPCFTYTVSIINDKALAAIKAYNDYIKKCHLRDYFTYINIAYTAATEGEFVRYDGLFLPEKSNEFNNSKKAVNELKKEILMNIEENVL